MRRRIKDIAEIAIGYQHRGKSLSARSTGSHRLIQIRDVDRDGEYASRFTVPAEYRLWLGDLYQVTPKGDLDSYAVKEGDVLFLSRGSRYFAVPLARPYVEPFPETWDGILAAYYFYVLRVRGGDVLPEYLAWSLNGERAQAEMEAMSQGSHMKMIAKGDFASLNVDVPPLETQHRIIDLYHLALQEQGLMEQIRQKRQAVVDTLCVRAAAGEN